MKPDAEIILLLNDTNPEFILNAYDNGIYDYFLTDSDAYEMLIKTINCFKLRLLKENISRNEKFLYQLGVLDLKTNLYNYKYLKEIFIDLSDNLRIQNGIFAILTLDETNKTKVSTNRLALAIKNSIRQDDIIAIARGGKFYLILPNIDLTGAKLLIQKIQNKMGEEFQLRAGLSKIGIQSFETLDKNSQDGLTSAIQNDLTTVCLEDNIDVQNSWLDDDEKAMFLEDLGLSESGLEKLIKASYRILGLISYLTAGPIESKAWTITAGTKAPQAAGKIHSDFERGFIKADVISYDDLVACGSMSAARDKGLVRSEGKEYVMQDGDVVLFKFNV